MNNFSNIEKLFENAPIGIFETTISGQFVNLNSELVSILGYDSKQDVFDHIKNLEHDLYEHPDVRQEILSNIAEEDKLSVFEIRFKKKDGSLIDVRISIRHYFNEQSKKTNNIGIIEDITSRKQAEQKIKENEALLKSIFDSIPLELWVLDKKGQVLAQSGYSKNLWGNYVGKNTKELPLPTPLEKYNEVLKSNTYSNKIAEFESKSTINKTIKYFKHIIAPYYENEEIKGHIAFSFDITRLKTLTQELSRHRDNLEQMIKERTEEISALNEELKNSNDQLHYQRDELKKALDKVRNTQNQLIHTEKMASIGVLTAGIAHEINNPTNFIQSGILGLDIIFADLIRVLDRIDQSEVCPKEDIDIKKTTKNIKELIEAIKTGVERITKIVKSLRTFSRMDTEEKSEVDVRETIESSLTILNNKYKYTIKIEKDYAENNTIRAYPGKIGQVVLNLLMNAIQAIEDKGIIKISTTMKESRGVYEINIEDNGMGMNKETQKKIFDPFFTTKEIGEGTGIGMSIVHSIIQDHNGEIKIDSTPKKGTKFTIFLPIE